MTTWVVFMSLWMVIATVCIVSQHFRIKQNEAAIARLSIALIDHKIQEHDDTGRLHALDAR